VTATVSAIQPLGARPVFADIEPGTMLLDVAALETMLAKLPRPEDQGRRAGPSLRPGGGHAAILMAVAARHNLFVHGGLRAGARLAGGGRMAGTWGQPPRSVFIRPRTSAPSAMPGPYSADAAVLGAGAPVAAIRLAEALRERPTGATAGSTSCRRRSCA
jgi:hypothetical protein